MLERRTSTAATPIVLLAVTLSGCTITMPGPADDEPPAACSMTIDVTSPPSVEDFEPAEGTTSAIHECPPGSTVTVIGVEKPVEIPVRAVNALRFGGDTGASIALDLPLDSHEVVHAEAVRVAEGLGLDSTAWDSYTDDVHDKPNESHTSSWARRTIADTTVELRLSYSGVSKTASGIININDSTG